jgi:hypothetical protein
MLAGRSGFAVGGSQGFGSVEGSTVGGEGVAVTGEGSTVTVEASPPDREPVDASGGGLRPHDEAVTTRREAVPTKRRGLHGWVWTGRSEAWRALLEPAKA